jgi:hypothetical protein
MKNLLLIALLFIIQGVYSQNEFIAVGSLYNDNADSTAVRMYVVANDGTWTLDTLMYFKDKYKVIVPSDEAYLLRFSAKQGDKFLWLDLLEPAGSYIMNVNFDLSTHGVIYYNQEYQRYMSYLVDNEEVKDMFDID